MRISGLKKSFGDKKVFSSLDLEIPEHELTVFMGPSGSGKTTLFRIILGLERPDSGSVFVQGRVGALFQEDRLIGNLSVMGNLMLVTNDRQRASEYLLALGLSGEEGTKACELSGGMARRVALARALLAPFDTLVVDEPFSGLDPEAKKLAAGLLLSKTAGRTVLLITHDADDLPLLGCPRVVDFPSGRMLFVPGL